MDTGESSRLCAWSRRYTFTSRINVIWCGDIAAILPIRSSITRKKKKKIEIDNIAAVFIKKPAAI